MIETSFFVPGLPRPGGSKKGFVNPKTRRVVVMEDNEKSKDWRSIVAYSAHERHVSPMNGPLELCITFFMPRPKGHFNSKGSLKGSAPTYHTSKPDTTKLIRSTEDALKGICWNDDSQIATQFARKIYGSPIGAQITVRMLENDDWDSL